jgi:hypothetical protein
MPMGKTDNGNGKTIENEKNKFLAYFLVIVNS